MQIMPDLKPIKIATLGVAKDFRASLIPVTIQSLGYSPIWSAPSDCELLIYGPFFAEKKTRNWVPKPLRPLFELETGGSQSQKVSGANQAPSLLITGENVRHDFQNCDYSISFDLGISNPHHFRMPYWMEMIDWSHEGIHGNQNPRYGQLLTIERLMQPLGNTFLERKRAAAFLSSHMREPRNTLFNAVNSVLPVNGFGPHFNKDIKSHHHSGILKEVLLQDFAFNLCPENAMYPGYYTEKIPEAFFAKCLPITWADENVKVDFNPNAFINLAPMSWCNFSPLKDIINSPHTLAQYASQALLLKAPSILPFRDFVKRVLEDAST
jgi:hypothetical protein